MTDVVVLGAHTAVARSLKDRLADRDHATGVVWATTSEFIEPDLLLLDESVVTRSGLFVLAMTGELPKRVAEALVSQGRPLIDVAEVFDEGPWLWPTLVGGVRPGDGLSRVAVGPAAPLAAVLGALSSFGPRAARITTLESAVARGQPGVDELSAQTRSVFAMRDADPEVFPASLAFDPIPSLATEDDHPHDADRQLVNQVQSGLQGQGLEIPDLMITRVLVPTFVADSAVVHVTIDDPEPKEASVIEALGDGRGLRHLPRPIVPALDAVDRDDALVSRVRVGPHHIDLWLAYDRTRAGSAVPVALAVDAWRQSVNAEMPSGGS